MGRMITSNTAQLTLVLSGPGADLPPRHLSRFVDQAIESLDLSAILRKYKLHKKRGRGPDDPRMLTKLIIYGYCTGIISERGIEEAVKMRFDFRFLGGGRCPDSTNIGKFKYRHLPALAGLYQQILEMAAAAGLIELKVTALDGTKVLADASKHKAMSIDNLCKKVRSLKKEIAEIRRLLKRLSPKSAKRPALMDDLEFKTKRFNTVKQAKIDLEQRIKESAEKKAEEDAANKKKKNPETNEKKTTRKEARTKSKSTSKSNNEGTATKTVKENAKPKKVSKPQINFTDKESRMMPMGNGWGQCYNAQAVVDRKAQIIIAHDVTQDINDKKQWVPMLDGAGRNLGLLPDKSLGDTGYYSESNVTAPSLASTEAFIPPPKTRHQEDQAAKAPTGRKPKDLSVADTMRRKLLTEDGKEEYGKRKSTVEPVFGQIKETKQHFRQFSYRGLTKVKHEWALVCLAHNLTKIFCSGWQIPVPEPIPKKQQSAA
jgi:transposase